MRNLTRQEQRIIVFLLATFLVGLGVRWYRYQHQPRLQWIPAPITSLDHTLDQARRIPINTADATTIARLPGVGPALAARIVEYRASHGPFRRAEDLTEVTGIGEKKIEAIEPLIRFD